MGKIDDMLRREREIDQRLDNLENQHLTETVMHGSNSVKAILLRAEIGDLKREYNRS